MSADVAADADADGNHALDEHDGDDHGDEATGDATEAVVPKVKTWRSDVAGVGPEGKPMVFDFTVVNLAAPSYRSKLKTKKNRVLRILKAAEDAKLKEGGRAALRAKALGADLVVLALSSNGAMSERTSDFFGRIVRHARKEGLEDMRLSFKLGEGTLSWTTTYFHTYWSQRIVCALVGTAAKARQRISASDKLAQSRLQANRQPVRTSGPSYGQGPHGSSAAAANISAYVLDSSRRRPPILSSFVDAAPQLSPNDAAVAAADAASVSEASDFGSSPPASPGLDVVVDDEDDDYVCPAPGAVFYGQCICKGWYPQCQDCLNDDGLSDTSFPLDDDDPGDDDPGGDGSGDREMDELSSLFDRAGVASVASVSPSQDFVSRKTNKIASGSSELERLAVEAKLASQGLNQRLLVELGVDGVGSEDERRRAADAVAYDVDGRLHRAWLLRQDSCPLGVLWNYYGDAGRGDTQEEMDAYNEFNTYGEFMDNPVAPWFANGDDENGGPDASTYFMG